MSQFVPRKWIDTKAPLSAPDKTAKSTSVSNGGPNLSAITTKKSPSVGFVGSVEGAVAGKYECEVSVDGNWASRYLSCVEIFNRCLKYTDCVKSVLGARDIHPTLDSLSQEFRPDDQTRELMVWLRSQEVDEIDRRWNEWNQEWREYVSGWATPEDIIAFGIVACAGRFARQAGIIRCDSDTPIIAVADYLEVISNHRYLTGK